MNPQEMFMNLLIAAMSDAAVEKKLTQLKTQIDPDGNGVRHVRIIVIPEPDGLRFHKAARKLRRLTGPRSPSPEPRHE